MRASISPRDDVAIMKGYHSPQIDVDVRLNTNESPYPPAPAVAAVIRDFASDSLRLYPDPQSHDLVAALAEHALEDLGVVERHELDQVAGPGRHAASERNHRRVGARLRVPALDVALPHHLVEQAVEAALDDDHPGAAGEATAGATSARR